MPYYEVYEYDDIHRGWGHNGVTHSIVRAKSKEAVKKWLNKPHDPFWIEHGVQKVSKEEAYRLLHPKIPELFVIT